MKITYIIFIPVYKNAISMDYGTLYDVCYIMSFSNKDDIICSIFLLFSLKSVKYDRPT